MPGVETLILRTIVIQFDGQVAEVFGFGDEVIRHHVALLAPVKIGAPDDKGRAKVVIGRAHFKVGADELPRVAELAGKINEAVSTAERPASPSGRG